MMMMVQSDDDDVALRCDEDNDVLSSRPSLSYLSTDITGLSAGPKGLRPACSGADGRPVVRPVVRTGTKTISDT